MERHRAEFSGDVPHSAARPMGAERAGCAPADLDRTGPAAWWDELDHGIFFCVIALVTAGFMLSLSAGPAAAGRLGLDDQPFYFTYRHGAYALIALAVMLGVSTLDIVNARRLAIFTLLGALGLMAAALLIGPEVNGAQRWLRLGPVALQPSEFAKPGLIVTSAWLVAAGRRPDGPPGALMAMGLMALTLTLLLMQPDVGQTALVALSFAGVFVLARARLAWIISLGVLGAGLAAAVYASAPHVVDRIAVFFDPSSGDTYQVTRALAAIERGGLIGAGPGEGVIKHQIPDGHTDFVFAVAVEEFGALFACALIGVYTYFVVHTLARASQIADATAKAAAAGLTLMIGLQALINIAVNVNLIPPKGMTLPFLSYGGSSLVALGFAAGLILVFTRARPDIEPVSETRTEAGEPR